MIERDKLSLKIDCKAYVEYYSYVISARSQAANRKRLMPERGICSRFLPMGPILARHLKGILTADQIIHLNHRHSYTSPISPNKAVIL